MLPGSAPFPYLRKNFNKETLRGVFEEDLVVLGKDGRSLSGDV